MSTRHPMLEGWGGIAAHLSALVRFQVSKDQARRYAARALDPLPVRRVGRLARQRIIAEPAQLKAWAAREWPELATATG